MVTIKSGAESPSFLLYKTQVLTFTKLVLENVISGQVIEPTYEVAELYNSHKVTITSDLTGFEGSNRLQVYNGEEITFSEDLSYRNDI